MTIENKKYAVFIDIDKTLMGKSQEALLANLETIKKLRGLGHKVLLSTGRTTAHIPKQVGFPENFDGIVAGAGVYVKLGDEDLFKKVIPHEKIKEVCRYFFESGAKGLLEGDKNIYFFKSVIENLEDDWIELDAETFEEVLTEKVSILKLFIPGKIPDDLLELLGDEYRSIQHDKYGEILFDDCNKAVGMEIVMDALGLPMEQSIAIGDSLNDMEMLERAGISVAMGNAIDEVKQITDFVTEKVDDAGLSKALKKIFGI